MADFEQILTQANRTLQKFKAGMLFSNKNEQKIHIALKLVESRLSEIDFVIWLAPASCLSNYAYKSEIKKNNRNFRHSMYFYSIESLSLSDQKYLELYNLIHNFRIFCVIDEGLTIKNHEAGRTRRLLSISSKLTYRLILNRVPLTLGVIDLYTQLEFLNPKILKMNEKQFSHIFMSDSYQNYLIKKKWSCPADEQRLYEYIKPYVLCFDFSEKCNINVHNLYFDLTRREQESYRDEKNLFLQSRDHLSFLDVVNTFQRMYTLSHNKLNALKNLIHHIIAQGEKVIVYIKYFDEFTCLQESHLLEGIKCVFLYGKSPRYQALKAFRRDTNVMFCTYGVDKYGISVQYCNNVIYFSQTFDYKIKMQSLENIINGGAPRQINIYDFWVNTNLENLMRENLQHKQSVLSNICHMITKEEARKL